MPETPTFAESGVAGFSAEVWYALLAPAGTAQPIVEALEQEASAFAKDGAVRDKLVAAGIEPASTCGPAFSAQLTQEIATYRRVAKALDLKVE